MGSHEARNEPIFDLNQRSEGKVIEDLPINLSELPNWLRKDSNWLYDRNIEIHTIVDFLLSQKRMLRIFGDQLSGRTAVITRAIKIVMARNASTFRDGVFMVDLENLGFSSVITRISESLRLNNPFPKEESLCRDLVDKKSLVIFSDCQMTSSEKT
jgi:hypothetical protein